jgi:hypothetical protein
MKVNIEIEETRFGTTSQAKLQRTSNGWKCGHHSVTRHAGGNGQDPWYSIAGPGFHNDWSRLEDVREALAEHYISEYFTKPHPRATDY